MTKWWHNSVVYQIYPRSFCDTNGDGIGDIPGIISKLDYLQNLGIDVIWLSPVYQSPMDDNGYDISDYCNIADEFGTMADMQKLLEEAKARNIRIVMDLVVNHTSDEHPWFIEARKSKDNAYRDFYIWRKPDEHGNPPNELTSIFSGSAWELDEESGEYYLHLFSKRQPDLNWQNSQVRQKVFDMMNWWIDQGVGGFRLDVIDLIAKDVDNLITGNGKDLHPMLKEMNKATFGDKDLLTVGETWGATPEIAKLYSNPSRDELSMVFQFEHITLTWGDGEDKWRPVPLDLPAFKKILTKWQVELADNGWNSLFWNNHDLPRAVSKFGCDQQYRIESAKMLATTLHMMKGTPYIYQGEELGMTNVKFESIDDYQDIETLNFYKDRTQSGTSIDDMMLALHENSRDNARTPMQWSDESHAGFTTGEPWLAVNPNYKSINALAALNDADSIFFHYKQLIQLRKSIPTIVYGEFIPYLEDHNDVFCFKRTLEGDTLLVVSNFSDKHVDLSLPEEIAHFSGEPVISNYSDIWELSNHLSLKPYESFVIRAK
ncbi:alpha-glucosidase (plasmid) [Photobacterium sp. DA100]|uniref:glycoside hydrolase family 13 protein n=1 Tax=Photobacterium sp. DA100 TaxID=3027472 RepID=UPI002479C08E|nr:alpha-glucosidase [Photobacterium sp. DA100]WEM45889.1 alpha-glucosidase [Photobacterium sp. DA100]